MTAVLMKSPMDTETGEADNEAVAFQLLNSVTSPQMGSCSCRCLRCSSGNANAHCNNPTTGCHWHEYS